MCGWVERTKMMSSLRCDGPVEAPVSRQAERQLDNTSEEAWLKFSQTSGWTCRSSQAESAYSLVPGKFTQCFLGVCVCAQADMRACGERKDVWKETLKCCPKQEKWSSWSKRLVPLMGTHLEFWGRETVPLWQPSVNHRTVALGDMLSYFGDVVKYSDQKHLAEEKFGWFLLPSHSQGEDWRKGWVRNASSGLSSSMLAFLQSLEPPAQGGYHPQCAGPSASIDNQDKSLTDMPTDQPGTHSYSAETLSSRCF